MAGLDTRIVGDAYKNGIAWETLVSLVDIENRMAAHEGEQAGARTIAETFEEVGLRDVSVDEFDVPGWWRGSSALDIAGRASYEHQHQVLALPGSTAGDESAQLVDVGHGTPAEFDDADIEGAIAMVSSKTPDDHDHWIHRKEKYDAAIEGGAVGFVFRNHVEGCLPPTGGVHRGDDPGPIPAVGVSRELGHRLVRYCEEGAVEATLSVDCRNEPATSQNVSGTLGPDSDERILVTAHHDAHDIAAGAEDNGAGSALVCELARLLSQAAEEFSLAVEFVTFGAEEIGLRGSSHMANTRDRDEIRAIVNLDAIGGSRSLGVATHGFEELSATFEAVSDALDTPIEVDEDIRPHSDHWPFVQEGIPGIMAVSVSESDGRGWGHTHADTLDKLDRRDFRDLAVLLSAGVAILAGEQRVPRRVTPETITERAADQGLDIS